MLVAAVHRQRLRGAHVRGHGHDDVDTARFRHDRLDVAHDLAVAALDHSAGHIDFDQIQRIVVVVVIAVSELVSIAALRDDDGLGHEAIVEPGNRRCVVDARNRERNDRRIAVPRDRRVADLRGAFLEQSAGIAEHLQRVDSGARQGCFRRALRAGPQPNQALIDAFAHRLGRAFARHETGARPGLHPRRTSPLTTSMLEYVRPFGSVQSICVRLPANWYALPMRYPDVPSSPSRGFLVRRDRTGLTVDLDRPFTAILERDGELMLLDAAQHAHVPRPVEQHGLQVFGAFRGRVGRRRRACAELRIRHDRHAVARPVASAIRVAVDPFLKAMVVPPKLPETASPAHETTTAGPSVPTAPAVECRKLKRIAGPQCLSRPIGDLSLPVALELRVLAARPTVESPSFGRIAG